MNNDIYQLLQDVETLHQYFYLLKFQTFVFIFSRAIQGIRHFFNTLNQKQLVLMYSHSNIYW